MNALLPISAPSGTRGYWNWALPLKFDIAAANAPISVTSLTLLPLRTKTSSNYSALFEAIVDAAKRGVAVRAYIAKPTNSSPATLHNFTARAQLERAGITCHLIAGDKLLHAKTFRIGDEVLWVGSGNMTAAAANHNYEFFLRTTDPHALDDHARFLHTVAGNRAPPHWAYA